MMAAKNKQPKPAKAEKSKISKSAGAHPLEAVALDTLVDVGQPAPHRREKTTPKKRHARFIALRQYPSRLREALRPYVEFITPVIRRARYMLKAVSLLGWGVLVSGLGALMIATLFAWQEFGFIAGFLIVSFAIACLFTIGRIRLAIDFKLAPQRIVVGEASAAEINVVNIAKTPVLPLGLRFHVGEQIARFSLPPLAPQQSFNDMVVIPTQRRGVIPVGPVRTQRGDPFGLVRREITWTEALELFVHPETVPLESLGAGLLRDLEGRTTQDISMSDLAFHTLREYAPGDDRRYIHWRSSAKLSGVTGADTFLVRQFLDTRRSHVAVIVDVDETSYADADEFELAISAAASVTVRAMADEMDLTIMCGQHAAIQPPPHQALDTFSRADYENRPVSSIVGRLPSLSPDASVVLLVTGSQCDFSELLKAKAYLPREVAVAALKTTRGSQPTFRDNAGMPVASFGDLSALPRVLSGGQLV